MKAIGYTARGLPIADPQSLQDLLLPDPGPPLGHDLLVRVQAVSVNPRDAKSRAVFEASPEKPMVLGYDASGIVEAVGPDCRLFKPGDAVFYAGVLDRPGSNAELQLVDERIVGHKPGLARPCRGRGPAADHPDRLGDAVRPAGHPAGTVRPGRRCWSSAAPAASPPSPSSSPGALTGLTVIATASRPESADWVRARGAHHVLDHTRPLAAQAKALGPIRYVFSTHTDAAVWAEIAKLIAPQGRFGLIDDPEPLDLRLVKFKSVSIHWEAMFTRPMFRTADMQRQHAILSEAASLLDSGILEPGPAAHYGRITAANLRRAHAAIEAGRVVGKIVLEGFESTPN